MFNKVCTKNRNNKVNYIFSRAFAGTVLETSLDKNKSF